MTKTERVRYEMLLRIRDFGAAHRAAFPASSTVGQNFARVAQAVAEIDAHATVKLIAAHEGRRARIAARSVVRRWMLAIARTARDLARSTPGLEKTFRMPRRDSDVTLLASARAFLDRGAPIEDDLVRLGLPATVLSDFRQAVDTLEAGLEGRRSGRAKVAAGQAGIEAALVDGMNAARTLDVVVTNMLGDDPVVFARWQRDRRLVERRAKGALAVVAPPISLGADTVIDAPPVGESGSVERLHEALEKAS